MKFKMIRFNHQNLKHSLIMGLGLTAYGLLVFFTENASICVIKVHTGLPCPGCGMTRAMLSVFHGDLLNAFIWHPLWPLVFILPIVIGVISQNDVLKEHYLSKILKLSLILIIAVYVVRMLLMFPNTAPMDFNSNAIPLKFLRYFLRF